MFLSYRVDGRLSRNRHSNYDNGRLSLSKPPLNRSIFEDVFRKKLSKIFKPLPGWVCGQAHRSFGAFEPSKA